MKTKDTSPKRLKQLDETLGSLQPDQISIFSYFIARELAALGQTKEAEKYWRRALVIPGCDSNCGTLAGMELAKRHGTSRLDDDVLKKDDLWPALADKK